jgi:hypothetical protein
MKKNYFLVIIFIVTLNNVFGEIRNGYRKGIQSARESLKSLHALLIKNEMSASQRKKVKASIAVMVDYISYYELTENLLRQFRTISPDLYDQIDTIRDIKGRSTDVYVKFIPQEEAEVMSAGITYIHQAAEDRHTNVSEYGERTISVKIWILNNALSVLSHELGHINYLVPNLASYFEYYRKTYRYRDQQPEHNCVGHHFRDLSGKNAEVFERTFKKDYSDYLKKEADRPETPPALAQDIRKKIQSEMATFYPLAVL